MPQTFAQYLLNKSLPKDVQVTKPVDAKELKRLLTEVSERHPEKYGDVVSDLKRIGDKFSTYEGLTMGIEEIDVPNRAKRDALIKKWSSAYDKAKSHEDKIKIQESLQNDLIKNDTDGRKDDATFMIESGAMSGSKKIQLTKLRTSPVVVMDYRGKVVPEIFTKGYSEGQPIMHHWLQAAEARKNLVVGKTSTSGPGEMNKVISNIMQESVVSEDDCGTNLGITLFTKDQDIVDRYMAEKTGRFPKNTLITPLVQKELLKTGPDKILVRSPQTCAAKDNTVCSKCFGLKISTGKPFQIGENAGLISAGAMSEPLTQMVLSAKHSVTMAKEEVGLLGETGFRTFTTMPKEYPNRKLLCELYGVVYRIRRAPQGGLYITIRETRKVPDRYIHNAKPDEYLKRHWQYYVPPQRKIVEEVKEGSEVFPGMELTDGIDNLKDIARLKNLGVARSAAAEGMRNVYRDTGLTLDRRHFELLSKNMMNRVKLEKVPPGFPYKRGDSIEYNALIKAMDKVTSKPLDIDQAEGATLAEPVNQFTVGTDLSELIIRQMKRDGVKRVKVTYDLEVSPIVTPITFGNSKRDSQWLGKLNHRFLKDVIQDAATMNQKATIHGYNPIASYAYGVEMRQDKDGRY